jgi:hypothetical protein
LASQQFRIFCHLQLIYQSHTEQNADRFGGQGSKSMCETEATGSNSDSYFLKRAGAEAVKFLRQNVQNNCGSVIVTLRFSCGDIIRLVSKWQLKLLHDFRVQATFPSSSFFGPLIVSLSHGGWGEVRFSHEHVTLGLPSLCCMESSWISLQIIILSLLLLFF